MDIEDEESLIIEMFEKYDSNFRHIKQILEKYYKYTILEDIKDNLFSNINNNNFYLNNEGINHISKCVQNNKLKLKIEYIQKPEPYNYNYDEIKIKESIKKIEYISKKKREIIWKPCREILGKNKVVILPEKIDNSNFNQGVIGDCYFISCVNSLSQIPQLLNFIMGLSSKNLKNENSKNFTVNFFIDGKWEKIYVKDSFPCFKDTNKLVGVTPKNNELFMMILEKAWAQINGGYDQIEGGYMQNIFELFLGCKCDSFDNNNINKLYKSIKKNEKNFGTLSLCGSIFYDILNKNIYKNSQNFIIKNAINHNLIKESSSCHAYKIVKTLEIETRTNKDKYDPCKFLIISNPHGIYSDLVSNGIELKKIEEILKDKFGKENKNQYEYILEKNKNYGHYYLDEKNYVQHKKGTGIIFMPLEYFQKWSYNTTVCIPHYGCLSYVFNIKGQLENIYIYKIKLNEKQLFTCQVCFQSFRAHRDKIDRINKILLSIETETQTKNEICLSNGFLLNYNFCGIKIIKNDNDLNVMKNFYSYKDDYDHSSIKEVNLELDTGEYFIMIYPESSINEGVIRFLSEKEIEIKLLKKINKNNFGTEKIFKKIFDYNNSSYENDNYKFLLNNLSPNNEIYTNFDKEDFLPGIKEYYLHFKTLAESKGLKADEAIYSISKDGETYFYDIIDSNTLNKIYRERKKNGETKVDQIIVESLQFRDSLGFPYKINNEKELIYEIKINKEPICCLMSQYDENTGVLTSGTTYLTRYFNQAKNEDILLIETDKSGYFNKRQQTPLFVIILDISRSMKEYALYLQNQLIPRILRKLGYFWKETEFYNKLVEKKITNFELLQAISSKIKLENFLNYYNLKNSINPEDLKLFCNNIIPLITFSTHSHLYFYDIFKFEKSNLCYKGSYFKEAAQNLELLLNLVSRERSIRLLSFSDGSIFDAHEAMKILDKILNSGKAKHQMNSVSVRVCHDTQPDTKILMKLSLFSHPICDMTQIVIDPKKDINIEQAANKIYNLFVNDDMIYNLKLTSDILFMSNDFSTSFSKEQYFNNKNTCIRMDKHREISDYQSTLKSPSCNLIIEEGGILNEYDFYNIMSNNASNIAQRILERKVNQNNNLKQNKDIIDYFKDTENYFENKNINNNYASKNNRKNKSQKLYHFFQEINENKEIQQMNPNKLSEYIKKVSDKANEIIKFNNNVEKNNNDDTVRLTRIIKDLKENLKCKNDKIRKEEKDNYNKDKEINKLNNELKIIKKENEILNNNYKTFLNQYFKLIEDNTKDKEENNKLVDNLQNVSIDKKELENEINVMTGKITELNNVNIQYTSHNTILKMAYNYILDENKKLKEENENLNYNNIINDLELNKLKEDNNKLQNDFDKLNNDYKTAKENEVYKSYYEKLYYSNNALNEEYNKLKNQNKESNIKEKNLKLENENLKSELRKLKDEQLSKDMEFNNLKDNYNNLKEEIKLSKVDNDNLKQIIDNLTIEDKKKNEKYNNLVNDFNKLKEEKEKLEDINVDISEKFNKEINEFKNDYKKLTDNYNKLTQQYYKLQTEKEELDHKCSEFKKKMAEEQVNNEELTKKNNILKKENDVLKEENNSLKNEITNIKQEIKVKDEEYNLLLKENNDLENNNNLLKKENDLLNDNYFSIAEDYFNFK